MFGAISNTDFITYFAVTTSIVVVRGILVMASVSKWNRDTGRESRGPKMPSKLWMLLKVWTLNPMKLTNDLQYLKHWHAKTGPFYYRKSLKEKSFSYSDKVEQMRQEYYEIDAHAKPENYGWGDVFFHNSLK